MKRLLMVLSMMTVLFSQSAMAMSEMTDEELGGVTAQSGILNMVGAITGTAAILNAADPAQNRNLVDVAGTVREFASLGSAYNIPKGTLETEIKIKDAVIDIDHMEFDLLKTEEFSLGHISMDGFHMEIASATISIWAH